MSDLKKLITEKISNMLEETIELDKSLLKKISDAVSKKYNVREADFSSHQKTGEKSIYIEILDQENTDENAKEINSNISKIIAPFGLEIKQSDWYHMSNHKYSFDVYLGFSAKKTFLQKMFKK